MKTRSELLLELQNAVKSGGMGGKTTAEGLRQFLTLLIDQITETGAAFTSAESLPTPRWQIRSDPRSPAPTTGPFQTPNFIRILFDSPLPPAVVALAPEIWLFTYNRRSRSSPVSVSKTSWGHPAHMDGVRHPNSAFWSGSGPQPVVTEFFDQTIQTTLSQEQPHADIVIDANEWFMVDSHARGKKGFVRRFRFALVVNAPANQSTPSGKLISPLSDEVWLSSRQGGGKCIFQQPVYNKKVMN